MGTDALPNNSMYPFTHPALRGSRLITYCKPSNKHEDTLFFFKRQPKAKGPAASMSTRTNKASHLLLAVVGINNS